jgi:organic radical activating enzyme
MFGQNPLRGPSNHEGQHLDVQEIFKTIQGEGPLVGTPSIFIRLGGCNLACSFCDTEFETFNQVLTQDIVYEVLKLSCNEADARTVNTVVITGGEPFRQPIKLLCEMLIANGYIVQIETNGTLYRPLPNEVVIVCSPKASAGQYFPIRDDLLKNLAAFKFLISANMPPYNRVPEVGQMAHQVPIYVQPMDQYDDKLNEANTQHTLNLSLQKGYIMSLQMHKILKIA